MICLVPTFNNQGEKNKKNLWDYMIRLMFQNGVLALEPLKPIPRTPIIKKKRKIDTLAV